MKRTRINKPWREEFKRLWAELVPTTGQAATVQGEVIRAVGRLSDEAYRNGNINFGKNHKMLCKFIRLNLEDPTVFSATEIAEIDECIDQVLDAKHPDLRGSASCHYRLAEKAVRWCKSKPKLTPHQPNPALRM
jgi:hypothetical protein